MKLPKEYFEKMDELDKICDEIKQKFNPEMFDLFEKYEDALELVYSDETEIYYVEGF